ncbi:MAG: OmpA family protein, partial [Terriglobia bacterium]
IGRVSGRGSATVNPTQTTTYTLTARGPSGSEQATATLQVVQPPPPPPPPAPPPAPAEPSLDELFAQYVQDIFFEFNKAEIRPEAAATLQRVAEFLQSQPQARILIEGHCDEIGSDEYNLALGVRRAEATKNYLISLGVNAEQLETLSLGKTQPFCTESREEACRQLNRRAHFVLQR